MPRIIIRVRPRVVVTDLDPDILRARARALDGWRVEVDDTRLTDAPFLTVVAEREEALDTAAERALKDAFADLPGMIAYVWKGPGTEEVLA
jgi:hypothetical protein